MNQRGTETQPAVAPLAVDVQEDPGPATAHLPEVEAGVDGVLVLRGEVGQPLGGVRPGLQPPAEPALGLVAVAVVVAPTRCPAPRSRPCGSCGRAGPSCLERRVRAEGAEQAVGAERRGARCPACGGCPTTSPPYPMRPSLTCCDLLPAAADLRSQSVTRACQPRVRFTVTTWVVPGWSAHRHAVEPHGARLTPAGAGASAWSARGTTVRASTAVRREVTSGPPGPRGSGRCGRHGTPVAAAGRRS